MLSRRQFVQRVGVTGAGLAVPAWVAGCGGDDDDTTTAGGADTTAAGVDTTAGGVDTTTAAGADTTGGVVSAGDPIKIGIIADLTGPFTTYGTSLDRCARLAIAEINAADGILGRQIEVITEDIQTDVTVTVDRATKLVESDNVDLVMGPIGSDAADAATQVVCSDNGKLLFYTETYEGAVDGNKCLPTFFSVGAVPAQQIRPFIPLLQAEFGPKVMLFGADYVWPRRSFEIAKPIIEENGGELVAELYLPLIAEDFTELVQTVQDTAPDYIFSLYPALWQPAMKALDDAGALEGLGVGNIFVGDPDLPALGDLSEGMYTTLPYFTVIDAPGAADFLAKFQTEYGADAIPSGGEGPPAYNAVWLYKQAVEAAGSTEPEAVAAALVGQTYTGPTGPVEMMPSHHLKQTIYLVQASGGMYSLVDSFADQDPEQDCFA